VQAWRVGLAAAAGLAAGGAPFEQGAGQCEAGLGQPLDDLVAFAQLVVGGIGHGLIFADVVVVVPPLP
jgi:hypothetical protein